MTASPPTIVQSNNPRIKLGFTIGVPANPITDRKVYTRVEFDKSFQSVYAPKWNLTTTSVPTSFDPEASSSIRSNMFAYFWNVKQAADAISASKPDFITDDMWFGSIQDSASGFVTAVNSLMPKILVPNKLLIANGIYNADDTRKATVMDTNGKDPTVPKDGFNWTVDKINGATPASPDVVSENTSVGNMYSHAYIKNKNDDASVITSSTISLFDTGNMPNLDGSSEPRWVSSTLTGSGALCIS